MKGKIDYFKIGYYIENSDLSFKSKIVAKILNKEWKEHELKDFMKRNEIIESNGLVKSKFQSLIQQFDENHDIISEGFIDPTYIFKPAGIALLIEYYENELENLANEIACNSKL